MLLFVVAPFGLLMILLLNSVRIVPPVHYGIVIRLGRRTGKILPEGLHFVMPLIDLVKIYEYKLDTKIIKLSFFSKDNLEIIIQALVQWRPDRRVKTNEGQNKFIENKEETIISGLGEAIKSVIGDIIGQVTALTFVNKKKAVEQYIDCLLRLPTPPHSNPRIINPALKLKKFLKATSRLNFYEKYSNQINDLLAREASEIDRRSEIENRYGIDIIAFDMGEVDFSIGTRKVLELKKQTEEKLKADELEEAKKVEMAKELKKLGLSPQAAVDSAEVTLDQAKKEVRSFQFDGLEKLRLFGGNHES